MNKKYWKYLWLGLMVILSLCGCSNRLEEYDFTGKTGGTSENAYDGGMAENNRFYYLVNDKFELLEIEKTTGEFAVIPDKEIIFGQFNIVDDLIIYAGENRLMVESIDGRFQKQLETGSFISLVVKEEYIYYSTSRDGKLFRINIKSGEKEQLFEYNISDYGVFDDHLFIVSDQTLYQSDLDGENTTALVEDTSMFSLSFVSDKLYFINSKDLYTVYEYDLSKECSRKITGSGYQQVKCLDENRLVILNKEQDLSIFTVADGSEVEIASDIGAYFVFGEELIFSDAMGQEYYRYNFKENKRELIYSSEEF